MCRENAVGVVQSTAMTAVFMAIRNKFVYFIVRILARRIESLEDIALKSIFSFLMYLSTYNKMCIIV